jgi:hypothetical protein
MIVQVCDEMAWKREGADSVRVWDSRGWSAECARVPACQRASLPWTVVVGLRPVWLAGMTSGC